ncbi:MAG: TolC family protein [Deltaproteobacteria bacterium]|jgi:TolC family type I secretion outer membrane protein|nr:TolC family protein [Deltaproteobacteria bacterium]
MFKLYKYILFTYISLAYLPAAFAFSIDDPFDALQNSPDFTECYEKQIDTNQAFYLADIIEIAICNSPTIRQNYMQARASAASYGQALSGYLPKINSGANLNRKFSESDSLLNSRNKTYNSDTSANLSLSWLLFDFGATPAYIEKTKQNLLSANFSFDHNLRSTIYDITSAYYTMLSYHSATQSALANEASAKSAFEAASKRYELGLVALSDKLQAETSYAQAQLDRTRTENNFQISKGKLLSLLNLAPYAKLNFAEFFPDIKELQFQGQLEDLIKSTLNKRSDLAAKKAELQAATANLEAAQKKNYPTLSLTSSLGINDRFSNDDSNSNNGTIGLELSFPIFTGFSNTYNIMQSRYLVESAKADLKRTQRIVELDVWDTYQNWTTAIKNHEISIKLLDSALENEKVALGAYKAGKGNILNLLNAQSKLATARVEKVSAVYNVFIAKSNLLRALAENE